MLHICNFYAKQELVYFMNHQKVDPFLLYATQHHFEHQIPLTYQTYFISTIFNDIDSLCV